MKTQLFAAGAIAVLFAAAPAFAHPGLGLGAGPAISAGGAGALQTRGALSSPSGSMRMGSDLSTGARMNDRVRSKGPADLTSSASGAAKSRSKVKSDTAFPATDAKASAKANANARESATIRDPN